MAEPVRKSESTNIVWWNQLKNVVIHTHQNLLYFLEIATIVTSSSQINHYSDLTIKAKTQAVRNNLNVAMTQLATIAKASGPLKQVLENIDITIKEQTIAQFENMIIRQLALMMPKPSQK